MKTTEDLFQKRLHTYTITHAIEDGNVLRFHVDYFKPQGKTLPKPGEPLAKRAIIEAILSKHDAATGQRRFNALLATSSINDAIEYHGLFKTMQAEKQAVDPSFQPLNIACVFSPPAEGNPDVKQFQEDLPTEKEDNAVEPEKKRRPSRPSSRITTPTTAQTTRSASSTCITKMCKNASKTSNGPKLTCGKPIPMRHTTRSTSRLSSTCC